MRLSDAEFGTISGNLGYQLRRTDIFAMELLAEELAELGLTAARATSLVYIALHEGCDQMALGTALGINRASTVSMVNALVAIGAVERQPGRDRRTNALHLTDTGRALRAEVERVTNEHERRVFDVLTPAERKTFADLLHRVRFQKINKTDDRASKPATLRSVK